MEKYITRQEYYNGNGAADLLSRFFLFFSEAGKKSMLLNGLNHETQSLVEETTITGQTHDQTAQLQLQNAYLVRQIEKLKEIDREKDDMINMVAHDLRAPLNRSKSLFRFLQSTQLSEEQKEIIDLMIRVNDEGLQLVEQALQVRSMSYKHPEPVIINLRHFIQDRVKGFFSEQALLKNIRIHITSDDHLEIVTDEGSLKRIMDNLISNALKFSPLDAVIHIRVMDVQDAVYISIQDQGPGISAEDQQKLFKRFQKLSARPTAGESSTGLGLSIVKELIAKLNGEIALRSTPGHGAEFIVRLTKTMDRIQS